MHLRPPLAKATVCSKLLVLLLLACLLYLPSCLLLIYVLLYVLLCTFLVCNHLDGRRELVALLSLSSWYLVIVVWLFLAGQWVCMQFMIVIIPEHTHLLNMYRPVMLAY